MAAHRRDCSKLQRLAMVGWLVAASVVTATPLRLEIQAPPDLAAETARLSDLETVDLAAFERLLGSPLSSVPITVVLVPEDADLAHRVPGWIAGFARGDENLIVLFPHRIPTYPHSSLSELVRHEVAHVLIDRSGGGGSMPRWFHEGLAMIAEGGWRMADRSHLAIAVLRARKPLPSDLDALFQGDERRVAWAYAVSSAFVRDLVRRHGDTMVPRLLDEMRKGSAFEDAFFVAAGASPEAELADFWRRSLIWYRWLPLVTSSSVLWIAVTLLALLAIRRRRERDRELLEQWEAEERWAETTDREMIN